MRVRFASPPRTAKTQEKQPLPPAHDEALGAIRDAAAAAARAAPGAPDAVALQGLLRRLGRVAVQVLEAEPEEKTPPRRGGVQCAQQLSKDTEGFRHCVQTHDRLNFTITRTTATPPTHQIRRETRNL